MAKRFQHLFIHGIVGSWDNICNRSPHRVTPHGMLLSPITRFAASALFLAGICLPLTNSLRAQSTDTISRTDVSDISKTGPQSDSPFFIERQEAKAALAKAGTEGLGMYVPKPPHPPVGQQMKSFFSGIFPSLKSNKQGGKVPIVLTADPVDFSLSNTPEIGISLKLSNQKRHEIELLYPSDQRLEILTKDPSGTVIAKWSEDRSFETKEGFVEVNPLEYVAYSERMPTAKMKAGVTYTIETSLSGQKEYLAQISITPRP